MKFKKSDIVLCVLFLGFLFSMLALFLFQPAKTYSEKEKRYLAEPPALTWETLLSGEFGETAESYLADHIPGRDFFVGVSAYYDMLSNRQATKDIYVAQDRLVEAPLTWDEAAAKRNMEKINALAESTGKQVDLMLVPSAGYIYQDDVKGLKQPYADKQMIEDIYGLAGENVVGMDMVSVFQKADKPENLYYRTDHHWTSYGAYTAYNAYMQSKGVAALQPADFSVTKHPGFYGSTYSRSGLWLTESENVEIWDSGKAFTVQNSTAEETHQGLYYPDRLKELDKYTVYLDGNHAMVRIQNPEAAGKGKLLVIRDSYANCLGTFLANDYEEVVLVDLRYYKKPVSELMAQEDFQHTLVCYSLSNFMTDANIIWLR